MTTSKIFFILALIVFSFLGIFIALPIILPSYFSNTGTLYLILLIPAVLYFVPTIIAISREHRNFIAIFVLNLFLGFTYVGWVVALVWSLINLDDE